MWVMELRYKLRWKMWEQLFTNLSKIIKKWTNYNFTFLFCLKCMIILRYLFWKYCNINTGEREQRKKKKMGGHLQSSHHGIVECWCMCKGLSCRSWKEFFLYYEITIKQVFDSISYTFFVHWLFEMAIIYNFAKNVSQCFQFYYALCASVSS